MLSCSWKKNSKSYLGEEIYVAPRLKGAEANLTKILAKNSNTLFFFYSNLHLTFLRSCCENIFKIICIVSEKIEKQISQFAILFFTSIRSCL